ncbi:response regulator [Methanoplanus sp. FWC-SCC4]|uniref:Response regulator n=1 Tax=Methanochimaera problematica TaxID=2609417 RepID=A0AA97FCY4_9EURY|nr:response regulator [Methanoplanus sp. FWC-SCC4]WOF17120.1 response regulator [Methanoplanus sp. FWC-SCC4]
MVSSKVLIVDDDIITAMGLESSLKRMGYDVITIVTTGEEAVNAADEKKPDVVIMDINLKDEMEGVFAAEKITSKYNIPVIFLTAHSKDDILKRALKSKPYGYLNKPVRPIEIKSTIETIINKHRAIEAEKELFKSERKHKSLFENMPQGILYISAGDMTITDLNPAAENIIGYKKEEMVNKNYLEIFTGTFSEDGEFYSPENHPSFKSLRSGDKFVEIIGFPGKNSKGKKWIAVTAIPEDEKGCNDQKQIFVTFEDITEKKIAEERFLKAFELFPNAVAIIDIENKKIIEVNNVFLKNMGYKKDQIVGKTLSEIELFADKNEKMAFLNEFKEKGTIKDMPVKALTFSGRIRNGYISSEKILVNNVAHLLMTIIEDRENFWAF